jgi:acetolactate decarboxylase
VQSTGRAARRAAERDRWADKTMMGNPHMRLLTMAMLGSGLLLAGCAATGNPRAAGEPRAWDGRVQVHGALRAMFHEGQTGPMVSLDSLLPSPDLYAVGALADLSGEVTVIDGRTYLAFPEVAEGARTELTLQSDVGATLLVAAVVPAWHSLVTDRAIRFEELDAEIGRLAVAAGLSLEDRFPFLLEGTFDDLQWHVIDGRRLTGGGSSHQDHMAAAFRAGRDRAPATLVGFYSENDQGVFTHMGSKTHIHCVLDEPLSAGHVDHVNIPAGITLKFPVGKERAAQHGDAADRPSAGR